MKNIVKYMQTCCTLNPEIGEVNGNRSNYLMRIIEKEKREFGKCDVKIKRRKV